MNRCLPEIWDEIFSYLSFNLERDTLRACTLLCRSLTPLAHAGLFRVVTLDTPKICDRFLDTVKSNTTLAKYVQLLILGSKVVRDNKDLGIWLLRPQGLELSSYLIHVNRLALHCLNFGDIRIPTKSHENPFQRLISVQSLRIRSCAFHDGDQIHAFLTAFGPSLCDLVIEDIWLRDDSLQYKGPTPMAEESCGHSELYPLPKLESLTMSGIDTSCLTAWLLRSGTAKRINTWTIKPSANEDISNASALASHKLEALQLLILDMTRWPLPSDEPDDFDFEDEDEDKHELSLSNLSDLKTIRVIGVDLGTLALLPSILLTLPEDNSLRDIEIPELKIEQNRWENNLAPVMTELDHVMTHRRFATLERLDIKIYFVHRGKTTFGPHFLPQAHERGILHLTSLN